MTDLYSKLNTSIARLYSEMYTITRYPDESPAWLSNHSTSAVRQTQELAASVVLSRRSD